MPISSDALSPIPLPSAITSRLIDTTPLSLKFHILEAGFSPDRNRPLILLLHGFPEIAYSWRHVMPDLATAGYYVVAPTSVVMANYGLGYIGICPCESRTKLQSNPAGHGHGGLGQCSRVSQGDLPVGHDFGAVAASLCALFRPDIFQNLVLISHPFKGSGNVPFNTANGGPSPSPPIDMEAELAKLERPRKHYRWYYSTAPANNDMTTAPQGLHQFLRGYFHLKSADWEGNKPHYLKAWEATELAKMPVYYVMDKADTMPEAVQREMKHESGNEVTRKAQRWLSDDELSVYVNEYTRTGFQGGLNWYRVTTNPASYRFTALFAGLKIEVPCLFLSGAQDWGTYQEPGVVEKMEQHCTKLRGVRLIDGAGHWLQQEQPRKVINAVLGLISGSQ